ncbi:MAG: hypothetical protein HY738_05755 [Bacteroidia bacterium]|nr:hypothetical protein [Bacteroidia bacterium]
MKTKMSILFLICFVPGAYSQNFSFIDEKVTDTYKVVYFNLSGVPDDNQKTDLEQSFRNDNNILSFRIINNNRCQLKIRNNINADYIRNILLNNNLDYDFTSVKVEQANQKPSSDKFSEKKRTDGMPEHYPVYHNTGNPEYDNQLYDKEKKEWISKYPLEVEQVTGKTQDVKPGEKRSDGMPEHYPIFIDTGNPDADNALYDKKKQEWIRKYPSEVEQVTSRKYIEEINNDNK